MRVGNRSVIALTFFCLAGFSARVSAQDHPLYYVHHALWELRDARTELRESRWQFGEHKFKAERAIDDAIRQIELLLRNAGEFGRGEPTRRELREEYRRYKHHPHLFQAVVELRLAHRQLGGIRHEFGGHKDAALRDMDIAANQIELMLKFARP